MTRIFARKALLESGWAEQVRLEVVDGRIAEIDHGARAAGQDSEAGIVIPGLANAHSHAFQRALAGHTEYRASGVKDTFWTWRERMYRLAGNIDAERLHAIARQLYSEMLAAGYTAVAEFHYLHSQPEGEPGEAMLDAIIAAADDAGIRLCYVPVIYERAGFDRPEPTPDQRRFALSPDEFVAHYEGATARTNQRLSVAIGAHSLRAVSEDSLRRVADIAAANECPMHIHIAEQQREVDQCLGALGERPVEWLLNRFELSERWCLVHATHMDDHELERLADTGAVVCVCPSTEANLGDGLFALSRWLHRGGRVAIGSDSHISINPFEELRWLEYGQRLQSQSRNLAAIARNRTGRSLFGAAVDGGAAACGLQGGGLEVGAPADLLVLDDDNPMLSGHNAESMLDALVFSGFSLPIDRVMVHGEWRVIDGRHVNQDFAREEFNRTVRELLPAMSED